MRLKKQLITEEYRKQRSDFVELGDIVINLLEKSIKEAGINTLAIEHRIKTEESLSGKLERKGDKYSCLDDMTDILGVRVVCFFGDDVDKAGNVIESIFTIDRENSVDKRALIKTDSFGYLSVHYICSLPVDMGYPDGLCGKKFEIQVRTTLQHTWACIEHDMGYKSDFGIPRIAARQFARIAGLLEIADDEFVRVRNDVRIYTEDIRRKIINGETQSVLIDMITLTEYVRHNRQMRAFLGELADICGSEISDITPESYIIQLNWLGKKTLADMDRMLLDDHDLALSLAKRSLENTELDILSSNVGLRFLCRAELLNKGYTADQAAEFFKLSTNNEARAERMAKGLFSDRA